MLYHLWNNSFSSINTVIFFHEGPGGNLILPSIYCAPGTGWKLYKYCPIESFPQSCRTGNLNWAGAQWGAFQMQLQEFKSEVVLMKVCESLLKLTFPNPHVLDEFWDEKWMRPPASICRMCKPSLNPLHNSSDSLAIPFVCPTVLSLYVLSQECKSIYLVSSIPVIYFFNTHTHT